MTGEDRHVVLADFLVVFQQLLIVLCEYRTVVFIHISVGIRHVAEAIERLLCGGVFLFVRVEAGIDGGLQTVPDVNVGESVEREVGDAPFVGVHAGIGDAVHLGEVGAYIVGTHELSVAVVTHDTILIIKDVAVFVAQIDRIDRTHQHDLCIDIVVARVLGVAHVGAIVGSRACEAHITADVEPFGGLVCGFHACGVALVVAAHGDTVGIEVSERGVERAVGAATVDAEVVFLSQGVAISLLDPVVGHDGIYLSVVIHTVAECGRGVELAVVADEVLSVGHYVWEITQTAVL